MLIHNQNELKSPAFTPVRAEYNYEIRIEDEVDAIKYT